MELRHWGRNPDLLSTPRHGSLSSTAPPAPHCPHRPLSGLSSPEGPDSLAGAGEPQTPPAQPASPKQPPVAREDAVWRRSAPGRAATELCPNASWHSGVHLWHPRPTAARGPESGIGHSPRRSCSPVGPNPLPRGRWIFISLFTEGSFP